MNTRPSIRRQRGQVLIAIFLGTLLFGGTAAGLSWMFGGSNFGQLRKQLKTQVHEPQRRQELEDILKRLQATAEGYAASHERQSGRLLALLKRHDAARAEVDQAVAQMDDINRFSERALLDLRYELRAGLSAGEWAGLFPPPQSAAGP